MDGSHVPVELGLGYYKPQRYKKNLHFNLHQDISQMRAVAPFGKQLLLPNGMWEEAAWQGDYSLSPVYSSDRLSFF